MGQEVTPPLERLCDVCAFCEGYPPSPDSLQSLDTKTALSLMVPGLSYEGGRLGQHNLESEEYHRAVELYLLETILSLSGFSDKQRGRSEKKRSVLCLGCPWFSVGVEQALLSSDSHEWKKPQAPAGVLCPFRKLHSRTPFMTGAGLSPARDGAL